MLPLWANPNLASMSPDMAQRIISILTKCTNGTEGAAAPPARPTARQPVQPDPATVQTIVEMGFSAARAEEALRRVCFSVRLLNQSSGTILQYSTTVRRRGSRPLAKGRFAESMAPYCDCVFLISWQLLTPPVALAPHCLGPVMDTYDLARTPPTQQVQHNSVELAMEWLFNHPEDEAAAGQPPMAEAEGAAPEGDIAGSFPQSADEDMASSSKDPVSLSVQLSILRIQLLWDIQEHVSLAQAYGGFISN